MTEQNAAQQNAVPTLLDALETVCDATPDRVVTRLGSRSVNYRDLAAAVHRLLPVIRANYMDDRSAFVAAIFSVVPALGAETDPAFVAQVIDRALTRIVEDARDLGGLVESYDDSTSPGTIELNLADLAQRGATR